MAVSGQENAVDSVLHFARKIIRWRKSIPQLLRGEIRFYDMPEPVLALSRDLNGAPSVLALFNLGAEAVEIDWELADKAIALSGHGLQGQAQGSHIHLPAYGAWLGLKFVGT